MSAFFEVLKTFQIITIKHCRFRLRKCYFGVLVVKCKAQKTRENLRREKSAEEIKRAFEKKKHAGKKKRYGAILFRNVTDRPSYLVIKRVASLTKVLLIRTSKIIL